MLYAEEKKKPEVLKTGRTDMSLNSEIEYLRLNAWNSLAKDIHRAAHNVQVESCWQRKIFNKRLQYPGISTQERLGSTAVKPQKELDWRVGFDVSVLLKMTTTTYFSLNNCNTNTCKTEVKLCRNASERDESVNTHKSEVRLCWNINERNELTNTHKSNSKWQACYSWPSCTNG